MAATSPNFNGAAGRGGEKPVPVTDDLQRFISASADGDVPGIQKFLQKFGREYVDASREGPGGYNAMMWTAKSGSMTGLFYLAQNGANVNAADRRSETPLLIAAWMGRTGAVLELLFRGANFNAMDNDGLTPAMRARKFKHDELAGIIDQYARGENLAALQAMRDALMEKEQQAAAAKAEAAIDRRTVPEYKDFDYFMGAAGGGNVPLMRKFLAQFGQKYIDVSREGEGGYNALMWASNGGVVESIRYLVANGADINARDKNNETPLLLAARAGKVEAIRTLLWLGAEYRITGGTEGLDPAARARAAGHEEAAKVIDQYAREQYEKSLVVFRTGSQRESSIEKATFKQKPRVKTL